MKQLMKYFKFFSPMYGYISAEYRNKLRLKYGFETWHCYPLYQKPYILQGIQLFEKNCLDRKGQLVEVGCGLGDIICNVDWQGEKIGYDISKEVIKAARRQLTRTQFRVGSFDDIEEDNIECLIMVNFIHGMDQDELKECVQKVVNNKTVKYIMMDRMDRIKYSEYANVCEGKNILGSKYKLLDESSGVRAAHGALRCMELWKLKG